MDRRLAAPMLAVLAVLLTNGCTEGSPQRSEPAPSKPTSAALKVETVQDGLEHPWEVGFLPGDRLLVTERPGRLNVLDGRERTVVEADLTDVYAAGEGGLMGLVVHPDFDDSRLFSICHTYKEDVDPVDVRVTTWRLSEDFRSAERVKTLVRGITLNDTGRHSGCRLELGPDDELIIGTGDSARGPNPQDREGLGGKVLRVSLSTGEGLPDNPFADSDNENTRRLLSFGHRNVQGVALRPDTDQLFTAEHGPDVDDEVNRIEPGGNYGWDPSRGGTVNGYDESVSMTDTDRFPDAVRPLWTTGDETEALCAAEFLEGDEWGELDGALVVTALKGSKLIVFHLSEDGSKVESTSEPEELAGTHGRLRGARLGPDGALYVTTDKGENDEVLRVTPA